MKETRFQEEEGKKPNCNKVEKEIQGIIFDFSKIHNKRYFAKKMYQVLSDPNRPADASSLQQRINIVRCLEKLLRTEFENTRDLKMKTQKYLINYEIRRTPVNERIKKARRKKRWTQKELAQHLGYKSHVPITYFEKGLRYPPEKVFQWLEEAKM